MTEIEDILHARLQKSYDVIKQVCAQWFADVAEMSAVLDSWTALFEEYYCASLVDIRTTALVVHSDIDFLMKSKTKRHLMQMLDELQIRHEQLKEVTSTVDKKWNAVLAAYKQHRNAFTADSLCTATALRPSVTEQMATLEHLNRQWQVNYATKFFCLQRLYEEDELNRVHDLISVWKDSSDLNSALQNVDLLSCCS